MSLVISKKVGDLFHLLKEVEELINSDTDSLSEIAARNLVTRLHEVAGLVEGKYLPVGQGFKSEANSSQPQSVEDTLEYSITTYWPEDIPTATTSPRMSAPTQSPHHEQTPLPAAQRFTREVSSSQPQSVEDTLQYDVATYRPEPIPTVTPPQSVVPTAPALPSQQNVPIPHQQPEVTDERRPPAAAQDFRFVIPQQELAQDTDSEQYSEENEASPSQSEIVEYNRMQHSLYPLPQPPRLSPRTSSVPTPQPPAPRSRYQEMFHPEPEVIDEQTRKRRSEAERIVKKLEKQKTYRCGLSYTGDENEKRSSDKAKEELKRKLPALRTNRHLFHYMVWATTERLDCNYCRECPNTYQAV